MGFFDLYDDAYDVEFKKTYDFTKAGLSGNKDHDLETLRVTVKTLFDYQALDTEGRGEIFLARNNASIAATEVLIHELLQEEKNN